MNEGIFIDPIAPLTYTPQPYPEAQISDEAIHGMAAVVLGEENGLLRVRMRYRYEGYVDPKYLLRGVDVANWEERAKHRVIRPFADILRKPSFDSGVIATLPRGAWIEIGEPAEDADGENWVHAALADGTKGFLKDQNVRPAREWTAMDEETARRNVVADAMRYLNAQYRWGGKTHTGIDCSGLTAMAYMLNGLYIYRDARIVEGYPVKEIPAEAAKPADLLFWPGHVGLYLGDGRYVHSTGRASGVLVNSLRPEHAEYREDLANVQKWGSVF